MISTILVTAISLALIALLVTAALSPIETLSWWAGWTEGELDDNATALPILAPETEQAGGDNKQTYIVYLSGVATLSGQFVIPREKAFIKGLKERLPGAKVIDDVFPYSPAGLPLLASPRVFERIWRWVQKAKLEGRPTILSILINLRNIFQVMVSADHRYGPIFSQGAASVIEDALLQAGYKPGSGAPVTIIGSSGGAQIAIGAAAFLKSRLGAPIDVIAIGGVMASDPGLHFVRRLHYIYSDKDNIQKIGAVMFPERWPIMAHSEWNIAKRDGRIVFHKLEDRLHSGPRGYFGLVKFNGKANIERTLEEVVNILSEKTAPSTTQ